MVTVHSADGAELDVETLGDGPGVVIVNGGGVTRSEYRRLAIALAHRCTVHTFDRPSRGDRADGVAADLEDLRSVLAATQSRRLFGHSIGAFLALEAARELPLDAVAVYDPAICVDDLFPTDFLEPLTRAVAAGDLPLAIAVTSRGLQSAGAASRLPLGVQTVIARAFLATPWGRRMGELLPDVVRLDQAAVAAGGPASRYAAISARVLLAHGARSPRYYGPVCERLAVAIPGGRVLRVPGSSHNAANIARPAFAQSFAEFLAAA